MNKEYLYLSDKELLVTDEQGHITKRNAETANMHDVLLLENNLEEMNERIIKLEKRIDQIQKNTLTTKEKITFPIAPIILGVALVGISFLFSCATVPYIIIIAIGAALGTAAMVVGTIAGDKYNARHMNGTKGELEKAYKLREDLKERLSKMKEKSQDSITVSSVELKNHNMPIHEVITLEDSTPLHEEVRQQLEEAYIKGYEQKVKKRTLKK